MDWWIEIGYVLVYRSKISTCLRDPQTKVDVCLCFRDHAVSHVAIHAVGIFTDTSIHRYVEVYVENAAVGVWHGVDAVDEKGLGFEERSLVWDN